VIFDGESIFYGSLGVMSDLFPVNRYFAEENSHELAARDPLAKPGIF